MTAQFLVQWNKRAVTDRAYRTKWHKFCAKPPDAKNGVGEPEGRKKAAEGGIPK